jgi:hypothetical protein
VHQGFDDIPFELHTGIRFEKDPTTADRLSRYGIEDSRQMLMDMWEGTDHLGTFEGIGLQDRPMVIVGTHIVGRQVDKFESRSRDLE